MKKNGYYICCEQKVDGIPLYGVEKKINQQIKVLEKHFNMQRIELQDQYKKIGKRLLPGSNIYYWGKAFRQLKDPALIYLRKPWTDSGTIEFFKHIKKRFPAAVIIVEVPTYPYDKEQFSSPKNYTVFLKDYLSRRKFPRYVDRIVTSGDNEEIFGVPTLKIINGTDVDAIRPRTPKHIGSEIHLLSVSSFQDYHGYDRIITGMHDYYSSGGDRNVILDLVGSGDILEKYKGMAKRYGLNEHIAFHGPKYGSELDEYYDLADIGLATFAAYRKKLITFSSLKTTEYIASGLPAAGAGKEIIFDKNPTEYYLEFPDDPSPIDINRLIRFYDKCYCSGKSAESVVKELHRYAQENLTWEKAFEPLISFVNRTYAKRRVSDSARNTGTADAYSSFEPKKS